MAFTKKQLIEHIARHSDQISREIKATPKGDNTYNEKILAVNKIALAALTASERPPENCGAKGVAMDANYRRQGARTGWAACLASILGEID